MRPERLLQPCRYLSIVRDELLFYMKIPPLAKKPGREDVSENDIFEELVRRSKKELDMILARENLVFTLD